MLPGVSRRSGYDIEGELSVPRAPGRPARYEAQSAAGAEPRLSRPSTRSRPVVRRSELEVLPSCAATVLGDRRPRGGPNPRVKPERWFRRGAAWAFIRVAARRPSGLEPDPLPETHLDRMVTALAGQQCENDPSSGKCAVSRNSSGRLRPKRSRKLTRSAPGRCTFPAGSSAAGCGRSGPDGRAAS